jgi:hypothetical protein
MIQPTATMNLEVKAKFSSEKNMRHNYGLCTYNLTYKIIITFILVRGIITFSIGWNSNVVIVYEIVAFEIQVRAKHHNGILNPVLHSTRVSDILGVCVFVSILCRI